MKYYVGDIVRESYYDLWHDDTKNYKIVRITKNYYECRLISNSSFKAFIKSNAHLTLKLVRRGLKEKLSKL